MLEGGPPCPCGSGAALATCCGPLHRGERAAETAQALMRSRYAAFALARGDYLVATRVPADRTAPGGGAADDPQALAEWAASVVWLGLTVHEARQGGASDEVGAVRFTARYLEGDQLVALSETSSFVRLGGAWRYRDGEPQVSAQKVERNTPCPCGSGKKFKACHA